MIGPGLKAGFWGPGLISVPSGLVGPGLISVPSGLTGPIIGSDDRGCRVEKRFI